jgi:hypothetical protein
MRDGFFSRLPTLYLVIGGAWSLLLNVGAALSGAPSAFVALSGGAAPTDKVIAVLGVLFRQIALWPLDVLEKLPH